MSSRAIKLERRCVSALLVLCLLVGWAGKARAGPGSRAGNSPNENLYAVDLLDDGRNAWAVGAFGSVYHSSDGGRAWSVQQTPVLEPLFDVAFVNESTGVTVGKSGVVLRTTDGGATWVRAITPTSRHLFNVAMIDRSRGWAVGDWGVMLETHDGGSTWQDRSLSKDVVLSAVTFVNSMHGWTVGEFGTILATSDGGATWKAQRAGTEKTLFGVSFANELDGWVVGIDGLVLRTRDGGEHWTVQRGSKALGSLEELGFIDLIRDPSLYDVAVVGRVGCIAGDTGTVLVTTDGGDSWRPQALPGTERLFWLRGVAVTPQGSSLVVGASGLTLAMDNGSPSASSHVR